MTRGAGLSDVGVPHNPTVATTSDPKELRHFQVGSPYDRARDVRN
jgi:hypothetical protein